MWGSGLDPIDMEPEMDSDNLLDFTDENCKRGLFQKVIHQIFRTAKEEGDKPVMMTVQVLD
jgi:hypothetical protein